MTDETERAVDRILALAEKATPGPWEWDNNQMFGPHIKCDDLLCGEGYHHRTPIIETDSGVYGPHGADKVLIAAVPEMVALLRQYRLDAERVAELCADWRSREPLNKSEAQLMRHATYRQCADELEDTIRALSEQGHA